MARAAPAEALVDYAVALEALLLSDSDIGEARRRFALHGAVYIAAAAEERRRTYKELLDVYSARSTLVHAVSPKSKRFKTVMARAQEIRDQACRISKVAFVKALTKGVPTEDTFLDALLDDNVELTRS
jgi:hypothetical protein